METTIAFADKAAAGEVPDDVLSHGLQPVVSREDVVLPAQLAFELRLLFGIQFGGLDQVVDVVVEIGVHQLQTGFRGYPAPPRRAPWSRADGADRRRVRRRLWVAGRKRACHATMPVDERALPALHPLTSHAVEMAERSTAGTLDLAFRHADSPTFGGEAANLALVCDVWGPLIVRELAR